MDEDVAGVAAKVGTVLRLVGIPAGPDRCERFARGVLLVRPRTRAEVVECALATLASSAEQAEMVARVFGQVTVGALRAEGGRDGFAGEVAGETGVGTLDRVTRAAREHAVAREGGGGGDGEARVGTAASAAERLGGTDFAELTPAELTQLAGVMRTLTLVVPPRRSRRQRHGPRGAQADLRATLRRSRQSGAQPFKIIRKSPMERPRKLVVLCDISGSMEPYARAMLQLLYCAAGGARAEVFSFATRLTRLTRALTEPRPGLALRRAGQVAPDWLGGTRIGASLKEFNEAFGLRGVARGAVVVVVSDGWDTGDPRVVRRQMERLRRVAFRIVWVNPRAHRPGYQPLAGGMAAAWPYCDAVVSAHRLDALGELTTALADPARRPGPRDRAAAQRRAAQRMQVTARGRAARRAAPTGWPQRSHRP